MIPFKLSQQLPPSPQMINLTHSVTIPNFNTATIFWAPGDVDMDTGTIPIPPSFTPSVNGVPATVTAISWVGANLLELITDDMQPGGEMQIIYSTTDNNLKNQNGIIAIAPQRKKVTF